MHLGLLLKQLEEDFSSSLSACRDNRSSKKTDTLLLQVCKSLQVSLSAELPPPHPQFRHVVWNAPTSLLMGRVFTDPLEQPLGVSAAPLMDLTEPLT